MKLKTSFFNFGVLRKNLSRFAPLWVLYAAAEVLCLLTIHSQQPGNMANDLTYIIGPVSVCHMGYAFLVAACLFGDLFDARLCNGLHAMPMRREGWLLTGLVSGLIFALIPALVGGGVACVLLGEYYWLALLWQAVSLLQFLFFFSLAVFSAMCAGNRLGMAAVYAILNFASMLIYWLADFVYEPLLPGVVLSNDWFRRFCPVITMAGTEYIDFYYSVGQGIRYNGIISSAWNYLYICAGVGAVLLVLSWLLYRKRRLETAGDFISFRPMRIFFLIAYTLAAGTLLYTFTNMFGSYRDYAFLVVGIVIGWYTGWMLLEKTVKIFIPKVLIGFVAFVVIFAASLGVTWLDPLGIASYIPEAEKVQAASLYFKGDSYIYESWYDNGVEGRILSDPADIDLIRDLHKQMLEAPEPEDKIVPICVQYKLKNGTRLYRSYDVPVETAVAESITQYFSNVQSLFLTNDWEEVKETADYIRIYFQGDGLSAIETGDDDLIRELLAAIEADCQEGKLAQHDHLHMEEEQVAGIEITWTHTYNDGLSRITRGEYVAVYEDSENLIAFLESLDAI